MEMVEQEIRNMEEDLEGPSKSSYIWKLAIKRKRKNKNSAHS
jgi:hypothetical protein